MELAEILRGLVPRLLASLGAGRPAAAASSQPIEHFDEKVEPVLAAGPKVTVLPYMGRHETAGVSTDRQVDIVYRPCAQERLSLVVSRLRDSGSNQSFESGTSTPSILSVLRGAPMVTLPVLGQRLTLIESARSTVRRISVNNLGLGGDALSKLHVSQGRQKSSHSERLAHHERRKSAGIQFGRAAICGKT